MSLAKILSMVFMLGLILPSVGSAGDVKKTLESKGIKKVALIPPVENKNYVLEFFKKEGMEKDVQSLTPQDIVNPEVFNAKNFPVAVMVGFEKYIQTVKEPKDGDIALLDYISKGGTLIVLNAGPTPFFFNEKNRVVNSASMMGINIIMGKDDKFGTAYGFEKIPEGMKLSYSVQKELKSAEGSLADKIPFPAAGDLRWRPTANRSNSKGYIPLISLVDDKGTWLGDAASYNSGIIYVWFRLTQGEEANKDKILSGIMKFAAKSQALPREQNTALAEIGKLTALLKKYKNIKIGLLPTPVQTYIEGWMMKSGVSYDKLTWEDTIDPVKFNARNYQMVVYAGGEKYKQTVKSFADVDDAMLRYAGEGGFILLNSFDPWPLFMNDENNPTQLAGKLGFPVCGSDDTGNLTSDPRLGGFEKPKADTTLAYTVNTSKLPSLDRKLAFPTQGDLRWRPLVGSVLPKGDVYISLVELYDTQDNSYGDGVAFISHKESQPQGSKGVYVWSRAAELFGPDKFYADLFNFIADNIK